ncbi:hypothetical protein JXVLWARM_CDS_0086 [Burkholderia phage Bm1]
MEVHYGGFTVPKIKHYMIITMPNTLALERRVEGLIGQGWQPLGGPVMAQLTSFSQAMVRHETTELTISSIGLPVAKDRFQITDAASLTVTDTSDGEAIANCFSKNAAQLVADALNFYTKRD